MKRIFIDSDVLQPDELRTAQRRLHLIFEGNGTEHIPEIFDAAVDFAWHDGDKAWEYVKSADEIYANTSLCPLCGVGTYTGSVVVMDVMMQKAIDENITGKSIFFMRPAKDIDWDGIDLELMPKAFENNKLFTLEYRSDFVQVDVNSLVRRYK